MSDDFYLSMKKELEQRYGKQLIGFIQMTVEREIRQVLGDSFDDYFESVIKHYEVTSTIDKKR